MEYTKCPLKKRPIFVIKEEEMLVDEDIPIDLTIKKKPIPNFKATQFEYQRLEMPLNFSSRLETIKEEDCYSNYISTEYNLNTPQDLSSKDCNKLENSKPYNFLNNTDESRYESTTNMNRNYNNNIMPTKCELNYIKTLRTSPISPNNVNYVDPIHYIEKNEEADENEPQDLTLKLQQIKPPVLATRNPNVIVEPNKTVIMNTDFNQNDSYYRCSTCNKCYSTYNGLIKHQQTHITNNEQSYINVIENTEEINTFVTTSNTNSLSSSQNTENSNLQLRVANIQRYQCKDCGKSYSTCSGLSKHQQFHCPNVEGNQVKKVFSCKNCDKVYVSLGALKMHIRTHTLPCKCPQCGKAFSRPWLLQGHIRTHTGEKPFSCQHCNRAFADRSNLRAHLQTHSDIKKYSCPTCTKTFSRMSLLGKHLQSGCSGIMKPLASSNSSDENSLPTYHNTINDYRDDIINNNNNNNIDNNNKININSRIYDEPHPIRNQTDTEHIQYINSVIKGPMNGHQNYQQVFESY